MRPTLRFHEVGLVVFDYNVGERKGVADGGPPKPSHPPQRSFLTHLCRPLQRYTSVTLHQLQGLRYPFKLLMLPRRKQRIGLGAKPMSGVE